MKRYLTVSVLALAVTLLLAGGTGCTKKINQLKSRDSLNQGVMAYKNAQYSEAVAHFKRSVELDPEFATPRLYLATAHMSQYVPGAESEENEAFASLAYDEFNKVLEQAPDNTVAIASIATLNFQQKDFDEAVVWYKRLISVDPNDKTAYYTMGVIAWTRSFQTRMTARAELGMTPDAPGPLKDEKVRETVREDTLPLVEEGLGFLRKALEIDPEYDDAMAYLNLLYRERADMANTKEEYEADIASADDWIDKTLETKKIKAERSMPTTVTAEE
jgi:tetratricopeptide (TPR) repeat protein